MATPKYDLETLLDDVEAFMKAELNPRLLEIDTEKADFEITPVPATAYYQGIWKDSIGDTDVAILYGVEDLSAANGANISGTAIRVRLGIVVIVADDGGEAQVMRSLYRYQRALKEIFEEKWDQVSMKVPFAVAGKAPFAFAMPESEEITRVIGINLECVLP